MNEQTITQIKDALGPLADKIGEGAGYSWELLVQGQVYEGIGMAIPATVLFILVVLCCWLAWIYKDDNEACPVFIMIAIILVFPAFLLGYYAILHLGAPEYMGLKELLSLIK